jgi:lipopolysaccharide transport system ATP-binding protein
MIKAVSSWVVLLDAGRIIAEGDPAEMASLYFARASAAIAKAEAPHGPVPDMAPDSDAVRFQADGGLDARVRVFRHGTGAAKIRSIELLDACHRPVTAVEFNDEVTLRVHVEYLSDVPSSIVGFGFRDRTGTELVGTNTFEEGVSLPARAAGSTVVVDFKLRLPLLPGTYSVSSAVAPDRYTRAYFDWIDNALVVAVSPPPSGKAIHGQVWLPVEIAVHPS